VAWGTIEGHDQVVEQFRCCLQRSRLASTFLFVGPQGIGKRAFATRLAQALLCQARPDVLLEPCGKCASCVQVDAGTHPDVEVVEKPADKSFIPVAAFIGEDGRRDGLCHSIALKPYMGGRKIAIIDDADYLNEEGANSLLKTLEEPPPKSVLILIGTSPDKQLPTIRSRSQIIRFQPLAEEVVARLLISQELVAQSDEARRLAAHSEGSLSRALELADAELWSFRQQLLGKLTQAELDSVGLAKSLVAFVDEAGKEASARRVRARQVVGFAAEYYRQLLRGLSGATLTGDEALSDAVQRGLRGSPGDEDAVSRRLDRTLEALGHIDRNAHQATLLECWLDDLARVKC
jgi:DNA polymerase III subunit delta'